MSNNTNLALQENRRIKGTALARIDRELKMLQSGPLGRTRLEMNIALDFLEQHPDITPEQAGIAAAGYVSRTYGA